ncbi:MrcB family domain-containing protein [Pyruvatibacter sp.]
MSEVGFRNWLEENYAPNTVNTKLFEMRQLQAAYGDLDELYEQDRLDGVMRTLQYSAGDKSAGLPNPSKLILTSDLLRDLSNYRTTINYYRNYREGKVRLAHNDAASITSEQIRLLMASRLKSRYQDLDEEGRHAHAHIHSVLKTLALAAIDVLGSDDYEIKLTSGFYPKSGVRGAIPKDLWFAVCAKENAKEFAGSPQLFMIVSDRGIEYGFAPSTHPSGFSNPNVKAQVRAAAPKIFDLLPEPDSDLAYRLSSLLDKSGSWHYCTRTRQYPNQDNFASLQLWLAFLRSETGKSEAGGAISRYLDEYTIETLDLRSEVTEMARIFRPLMETTRAGAAANMPKKAGQNDSSTTEFANRFESLILELDSAREGPFGVVKPLWEAASLLRAWLSTCPPIQERPYITVGWSAGKGVWARVPWISILNTNITTSTQEGLYCVFLISQDLKTIYLTLAQGVTEIINKNGPTDGAQILEGSAGEFRTKARELDAYGFTLGNDVDLKCDGNLATNYERGTVAYMKFDVDSLPTDASITAALEALLRTYDKISEDEAVEHVFEPEADQEPDFLDPYTLADAMEGLFMPQDEFERILTLWRLKKNIILQGAPGVGKSFVSRRLAYALLGARDLKRVETVQFHQSYGYEDFVQGYRPNGSGGFDLRDGVFYDFCSRARKDLERPYVFIIDEINRGNLSKIFGELMLLIETDKRSPEWAAKLSYAKDGEDRFFVPPNVHIIGMMNTADRSLSLVDYALRRRFGFLTLHPQFESPKFTDALTEAGVEQTVISHIVTCMHDMNQVIMEDTLNLGRGFRIGHSFFVPSVEVDDPPSWLNQIVETEIRPLLEEYWLDDDDKVELACRQLQLSVS